MVGATSSEGFLVSERITMVYVVLIAAFAELQTEVIDFTSDLNVIGILFWDYQTYTFKVLFPSYSDHPVFHGNVCQV